MRTLAQHNLIDEYQIWVHPVVLGGGNWLSTDGFVKETLKLAGNKSLSSGVVILTYQIA